ncbi:hypothetical protein [Occallatibacter savannae]|uniref:hypothetical protein n=1 Tax=Occallatibacter savannae TaxID=1002691 RepID=UPI0013A559F5|nr:hypothetical protein [Occallatibacter savannae]
MSDSKPSQTLSRGNDFRSTQSNPRRAHIAAILSLCAIAGMVYGIFVRSVGFYWDDWPVVWVYNSLGSQGITRYFAGNRPFSGWIYAKLAPLFGISPVGWQAANVGVRCLASIVVYFLFCELWPRRKDLAWIIAALVLLYPGFTQQAIALTYLSQFSSFLLFVTSLLLTVLALRSPRYKWPLLLLSLVLGIWSYLITEYFVGLEFLRPVIIYLSIAGQVGFDRKRLRDSVLSWNPYAAAWAGYVYWRSFIFHEIHYHPIADKNVSYLLSRAQHNPIKVLGGLLINAVHNVSMGMVGAFMRPWTPDAISPGGGTGKIAWLIGIITVGISLLTVRLLSTSDHSSPTTDCRSQPTRTYLWGGFAIAVAGACFGGLPFISGQSAFFASVLSFGDRFTYPFMLPACVGLACLLAFVLTRKSLARVVLGLIFFAFSVYQVQCMNTYRHDWLGQKALFWQIAWRFPSMEPGSTIFVDGLSESVGSGETPGLLDLLYKRDDRAGNLDYMMFDLQRFPEGRPSYKPSSPIVRHLRSFSFSGNTSKSVVSCLAPDGILRVVTPATAGELVQGPSLCANIAQISNPEAVTKASDGIPQGPLLRLFGSEPKHDWQFYFQKADLERQQQHWDNVVQLGDEAMQKGYGPTDASEWFPFIDGYAHAHRYQKAEELSERLLADSPESIAALSSLWLRCSHECGPDSPELSDTLKRLGSKLILSAPHSDPADESKGASEVDPKR